MKNIPITDNDDVFFHIRIHPGSTKSCKFVLCGVIESRSQTGFAMSRKVISGIIKLSVCLLQYVNEIFISYITLFNAKVSFYKKLWAKEIALCRRNLQVLISQQWQQDVSRGRAKYINVWYFIFDSVARLKCFCNI